jgi:heptosyltransferase-2
MKNSVNKILVIQTAFIGDVIMSTPIYKGLKKIYPEASIDVLVAKQNRMILTNNPNIRKIYTIDKKNIFSKYVQLVRLIFICINNHYDLAISLQIHFTNSILMLLSGIKIRIGSRRQKLLTDSVLFPKGIHMIERIGKLLQYLKLQEYDLTTELFPSGEDKKNAETFVLRNENRKIGMAPGSVRVTKKWPPEYFHELIKSLPDNFDIYLFGSKEEIVMCTQIIPENCKKNIILVAGKCSILQSAALIKKMDLMLTNDSAPLHISNAMDTPVFAFFGPTVKRFGCYPYREKDKILEVDIACRPCRKHGGNSCVLGHFRCMKDIKPEEILKLIKDFFYEK